jgi:alkylation response protein AidB-like acyl-CoA dehydrogenase
MVALSPVDAARSVLEVVERHRSAAEHDARMADPVREAVGDARLFALAAPADCGGLNATLPQLWETVEVIAEVDPTVSWHLANSSIAALVSARLDEASRAELYADPRFPYGNGAAPVGRATPAKGGYRLSGRWPFVTGIEHSAWNALAALVESPDGVEAGSYGSSAARVFLVPSTELRIERTWDESSAMRGTGSHAVCLDNVFVERRFAPSWTEPPLLDRPLNRLPRPLGFGGMMASIEIGILRSAIDATRELGRASSDLHGAPHGDQPRAQLVITDAEATWRALRLGWHDMAHRLWAAAEASGPEPRLRAEGFSAMFNVVDTVRRTVSELYSIATNAAYRTQNRIERALRDSHAGAAAVESFRGTQYDAARVFSGGAPLSPVF